jgi:hypothetical protein
VFTVSAGFIGDFKLGDNINHNLSILKYIYARQADPRDSESWLLRKPAIVTIGSICEAILHDLHMRMNVFTREGVAGIASSVLSHVRGKKIDKFEKYIASARKHSLLGHSSDSIYDDLEELRKLRNRVHIQNEKGHFEPNEGQAFSSSRQASAEMALERLMKVVAKNHPRPTHASGHVQNFMLPWSERFP